MGHDIDGIVGPKVKERASQERKHILNDSKEISAKKTEQEHNTLPWALHLRVQARWKADESADRDNRVRLCRNLEEQPLELCVSRAATPEQPEEEEYITQVKRGEGQKLFFRRAILS